MIKDVEMVSSEKRTQGRSNFYLRRFEGWHPLEKAKTCSVEVFLQEEKGRNEGKLYGNRLQLAAREILEKCRAGQQWTEWPCAS